MKRTNVRGRKLAFFVAVAACTAVTLLAGAQPKKPAAKPAAPAAAPKKGTAKPAPTGTVAKPTSDDDAKEPRDAGAASTTGERGPSAASAAGKDKDAGAVVEQKSIDGGTRVFRFGEVEVEGRLKSPQIVYFLRRVRAEFAAGDLGHRSFMRELSETRNEPSF
jgi:hypothetical protein